MAVNDSKTTRFSLDKNTSVTIGLVLALIAPIGVFSMWISDKFNQLDRRLEKIEENRWTQGDMKVWAAQFKALNPEARVPEVD